jgi:ethanolamine transporter EutH
LFLSRFTGENFLDKQRPKNVFDGLFLHTVAMAVLVYAIPFFQADYTSLPLTVGILSGLMWLPFSWIIGHWVSAFHALTRTGLVTAAWYLFPTLRFVVIPAVIVMRYAVTIIVLEARWRRIRLGEPS